MTNTEIVNEALIRIGVTRLISSLDTETSREAATARQLFTTQKQYVLRDFPWPWATSYAELSLVSSVSVAVNVDWYYSYRYPGDCLFARRILTATGRQEGNPVPFRVGRDSQGKLIYTDQPEAELEYTVKIADEAEFDPIFGSMLAWKMAAALAPSLSRIDNMMTTAMQGYEIEKTKAQSTAMNEGVPHKPLDAEWVRAREGQVPGVNGEEWTAYPDSSTIT